MLYRKIESLIEEHLKSDSKMSLIYMHDLELTSTSPNPSVKVKNHKEYYNM